MTEWGAAERASCVERVTKAATIMAGLNRTDQVIVDLQGYERTLQEMEAILEDVMVHAGEHLPPDLFARAHAALPGGEQP